MQDKPYKYFSQVYDVLYKELHRATIKLLNYYFGSIIVKNKKLLDMGCGTGTFLLEMTKNGWTGTGIDLSLEMIRLAETKARKHKLHCNFLVRDMRKIQFKKNFDLITCNFDTVNYILLKKDMTKVFNNAHNLINENGHFIFDIITPYQGKKFLETFNMKFDAFEMKMSPTYNEKTKIKTIELTLIFEGKTYKEKHIQRCYEVAEISSLLEKSGFVIKQIWDIEDKKDKKIDTKTTRAMFVCQKYISSLTLYNPLKIKQFSYI
ncbi:MAG: class I SAM-dependent methyltransferase [bacterium]|nr:class I SAM-dependent methyltransferase [bacterium]